MGRKKKDVYEEAQKEGTSLEDYIIPQKIDAFCDEYQPADAQRLATHVFDETELRKFFKAYVTTLGDPLTIYLSRLEEKGFKMQVSMMNEPAIFVINRAVGGIGLLEHL